MHAATNQNKDTRENHTLEESPGPSKQAAPDCMAHIVMLTEKVNALRCCANEGCQKRRNDPAHILNISSDEEEELIPAHVAFPPLRMPLKPPLLRYW